MDIDWGPLNQQGHRLLEFLFSMNPMKVIKDKDHPSRYVAMKGADEEANLGFPVGINRAFCE